LSTLLFFIFGIIQFTRFFVCVGARVVALAGAICYPVTSWRARSAYLLPAFSTEAGHEHYYTSWRARSATVPGQGGNCYQLRTVTSWPEGHATPWRTTTAIRERDNGHRHGHYLSLHRGIHGTGNETITRLQGHELAAVPLARAVHVGRARSGGQVRYTSTTAGIHWSKVGLPVCGSGMYLRWRV
jgi:hypothetical protein